MELKKLNEICLNKEGLRRGPFGSAIKKEFFVPSGYKVYEQSNAIYNDSRRGKYFIDKIKYNELINFSIKPGDLIVSCSGTLGKISEIPSNAEPGIINQALLRIRLQKDIIDNKYFLYYFRSSQFQRKIFLQSQGTAMSNLIGIKDFKLIEIPVPGIKTQQAIVSKIEELFSELDKGIENLKLAQVQLKTYRQAVLKCAFEGKLTNKDVKEERTPEGWDRIELRNLVQKISDGPFGSNLKSIDYVDRGIRVIRLENIGVLEFKDEYKTFVSEEKYETIKNHTVGKGDIIFSSFIIDNIRSTILPNYIEKAINKADCFLVRCSDSKINRKYLCFYFSTKAMKNQLEAGVHGATRPRINTTQLKSTKIPVCSIEEQNQIVQEIESRLSVADKMEESIKESLQQAEALRQSILKKAFEGKLV